MVRQSMSIINPQQNKNNRGVSIGSIRVRQRTNGQRVNVIGDNEKDKDNVFEKTREVNDEGIKLYYCSQWCSIHDI
jgi:trehalose-6-phosphatase